MNILIIGSEGSLGKSIKEFFLKNNDIKKIYCVDKNISKKKFKKFIFKKIDLSKNVINTSIAWDIDIALFLSFNLDFNNLNKIQYMKQGNNILRNGLNIIKKNKIKKVIYFSSFAVYGENKKINFEKSKLNPINPYGALKVICEKKIIKNSKNNYKYLILRISQIYGEKIKSNIIYKFIQLGLKNKAITIHGDGNQKRDFVSIKDFLNLISKCLNFKKNQICNVSGDKEYKIIEIVNFLKFKYQILKNFNNPINLKGNNNLIKKEFNWRPKVNFKKELLEIKKKLSKN